MRHLETDRERRKSLETGRERNRERQGKSIRRSFTSLLCQMALWE